MVKGFREKLSVRQKTVLWCVLAFLIGVAAVPVGEFIADEMLPRSLTFVRRTTRLSVLAEVQVQDGVEKVVRLYGHRSSDGYCFVRYAVMRERGSPFQEMIPLHSFFQSHCRSITLMSRVAREGKSHYDLKIRSPAYGAYDVYTYDEGRKNYVYVRTEG